MHDSLAGRLTRISTRPDARREIPHNRLHVMVHMDNKVLRAIKYRYPIHEVVILTDMLERLLWNVVP
jgi:hypothetical protein